MPTTRMTALGVGALLLVLALFQAALALGAPWGEYAMGGVFPGVYPPGMRVAAAAQILAVALIALVILARAGVILPSWAPASRALVWPIVVVFGIGAVLNLITPSPMERLIWAPVAIVVFLGTLKVALSR